MKYSLGLFLIAYIYGTSLGNSIQTHVRTSNLLRERERDRERESEQVGSECAHKADALCQRSPLDVGKKSKMGWNDTESTKKC